MRMFYLLITLSVCFCILLLTLPGCNSWSYEATKVYKETLQPYQNYSSPTKVFLFNDNIVIFPEGITLRYNHLFGNHRTFNFKGEELQSEQTVPLDSVVAIIQYEENTSGGMYFADVMNGLFGTINTTLAVICAISPKTCFGSCPTVYVPDDNDFILQAELFSKSISHQLESNDLDILDYKIPESGDIKLKITNEALETHYINQFNLIAAKHKSGTKVFQTNHNSLTLINSLASIQNAKSSNGKSITEILREDDNNYFRSEENKILELRNGPVKDFIEVQSYFPDKEKVNMLIKYRNTLLTTTLLYDVVIGSQGINALEWTRKMNEDKVYAMQFKTVYDMFSGINMEVYRNNGWIDLGKFEDAGPINWKYSVAEIPVNQDGLVRLKLSFIPDNIMIDYLAFDTTENKNNFTVEKLTPISIKDHNNSERINLYEFISTDDSTYLVTNPGDNYLLKYCINTSADSSITLFIESKGYYNEWIRGNWIRENNVNYTFNLFDIQGTLNNLVDSWLENKDIFEEEFFNTRIPLKEAK